MILALPHLGGWEWAGRWLALRGVRITVVVERLDPPELFDWFVDLRSELGMTVVALGPDAGKAVLGALRRNEVVCLLCDRDLDGRGVEVEFFGERTTLPAGPATLGIRTGAPILPTAVYFTPRYNGHFGLVRPPLDTTRSGSLRDDVARVTQQLARELELLITPSPPAMAPVPTELAQRPRLRREPRVDHQERSESVWFHQRPQLATGLIVVGLHGDRFRHQGGFVLFLNSRQFRLDPCGVGERLSLPHRFDEPDDLASAESHRVGDRLRVLVRCDRHSAPPRTRPRSSSWPRLPALGHPA